jgi:hypothetical protein
VTRAGYDGDAEFGQLGLQRPSVDLLELTISEVVLLILDRGLGSGNDGGREGGGEDETWGVGTDRIDEVGASGHVTSHDSVGLSEGTGEHVHAVHDGSRVLTFHLGFPVEVFGYTRSTRAVCGRGKWYKRAGPRSEL